MKTMISRLLLIIPAAIVAQPTINNAEQFGIGTKLAFRDCQPDNVFPGNSGPSQVWNFSTLSAQGDTVMFNVLSPASTSNGSLFPGATTAEKYSTGQFGYFSHDQDGKQQHGYADTTAGASIAISYPDPMRILKFPITYGALLTDTFTDQFTTSGYNFSGRGTVTISADAYGTLILPGKTYSNTLRIRIAQEEEDTLLQFGTLSHFSKITYKWYHPDWGCALFMIDSINTGVSVIKEARYLLTNYPTGLQSFSKEPDLQYYPNPATDELCVLSDRKGSLEILDQLGRVIKTCRITGQNTLIRTDDIPAGVYTLVFQTPEGRLTTKLVIRR